LKILIDTYEYDEYIESDISDYDNDDIIEEVRNRKILDLVLEEFSEDEILDVWKQTKRTDMKYFELFEALVEAWDEKAVPHLWRISQIENLINRQ
jgi:transposase